MHIVRKQIPSIYFDSTISVFVMGNVSWILSKFTFSSCSREDSIEAVSYTHLIVRNSHTVAPISVSLDGKYGLEGLCLSIPTIVGRGGAEQVLEIDFSEEEMKKLRKSAEELGAVLDQVNIEK